jgi:hypothetical protein
MQKKGSLNEYIAVYVDNFLIAAKDPNSIVQTLQEEHNFKFKGVGSLTYHPTFTTWRVPCVMDQGSILIRSWDNMRTCLVASP